MFCRKCGVKILDDSVFCPECGEKVETVIKTAVADFVLEKNEDESISSKEKETSDNNSETADNDTFHEHNEIAHSTIKKNSKKTLISIRAISVVILLIVIIFFALKSGQCEYYKDCSNKKVNGTDYCYSHLCDYPDCTASKEGYSSNYCYDHQCSYTLCDSQVLTGSKYCSTHTCGVDGCYNEVEGNSSNCSEHQIDMRNKLSSPSMYFRLNSAGGIEFSFSAINRSGKTIKYARFNAYLKNAVGDSVAEDISNNSYADVEIIGPISNAETVQLSSEIIGYCDDLARIDIRDITLIYTDGTSETGSYNYYCD